MLTLLAIGGIVAFFGWISWLDSRNKAKRLSKAENEQSFYPHPEPLDWMRQSGKLAEPEPTFERREYFFTYTEMCFYRALQPLVEKSGKILFSKVRLEDLVKVRDGAENHFGERNRIKSRHIDFVICDDKAKPLLAIELDDHYHNRRHVQKHDRVKNHVCQDAGIPLLRVPVQKFYDPSYLTQLIRGKIGSPRALVA